MAVSASDIRSALSLPEPSPVAGPSQPKRPAPTTRKPEGISRELYSLIGPSQPSVAAQVAKPRLKQKPRFATGISPATKWELRSFQNPTRQDGLQLKHWVKASDSPDAEYPFAKYNIQNPVYTYTQDEYSRFLDTSNRSTPKDGKGEFEKPWTKEWTDYLFKLYHEYDGRWHVIWDRAEFPPEAGFDLEDLKHRYYSVCRKLIRNRPWPGDEASRNALINSLQFDIEREQMRKRYLVSLESRTADQLAEEEALYLEVRRLEQTERRFKREREDLLRTLAGMDSGLPYLVEDNGTPLGVYSEPRSMNKKRKNNAGPEIDSPLTPSGAASSSSAVKRPQNTKSAAYDAQHCIIRTELPSSTSATKAAHQPAYIRSSKIPYLKNNSMQTKVLQAFAEMGLSPSRLVMPTKENVAQLEGLLEAVTAMLETKKLLDKVDHDIQVTQKQTAMRNGQLEDGEGDAEPDVKTEEPMDVDQAQEETDGNEGRGHSVMSVRSIRSRKKSHRSMSISSVDTNATSLSTRNTKRQKRG